MRLSTARSRWRKRVALCVFAATMQQSCVGKSLLRVAAVLQLSLC